MEIQYIVVDIIRGNMYVNYTYLENIVNEWSHTIFIK